MAVYVAETVVWLPAFSVNGASIDVMLPVVASSAYAMAGIMANTIITDMMMLRNSFFLAFFIINSSFKNNKASVAEPHIYAHSHIAVLISFTAALSIKRHKKQD